MDLKKIFNLFKKKNTLCHCHSQYPYTEYITFAYVKSVKRLRNNSVRVRFHIDNSIVYYAIFNNLRLLKKRSKQIQVRVRLIKDNEIISVIPTMIENQKGSIRCEKCGRFWNPTKGGCVCKKIVYTASATPRVLRDVAIGMIKKFIKENKMR